MSRPDRHRQLNLPPVPVERIQTPGPTCLNSFQRWKALVSRALGRADLSKKVAASELGISESQLSNQLAYDGDTHRDHLSFWRMERLPPEFWQELLVGIAEHYDLTVQTAQDRADIELGRRFRALLGLAVSG